MAFHGSDVVDFGFLAQMDASWAWTGWELYSKHPGKWEWGAKQTVVGIRRGSTTLPFDIMIPWNIVRRIPGEDGRHLMDYRYLLYFALM